MKGKMIAAAIAMSALFTACAEGEAPAARDSEGEASGSEEGQATGDQYAAQLGLVPHAYDKSMDLTTSEQGVMLDGTLLEGCENGPDMNVSMAILESGTIYCYTWTDELEAWVIGQRLQGHVPTESEIADREAELSRG
jgi:hypothetical protein